MMIGLGTAIALFLNDRRVQRVMAVRLEKMRNSAVYQELYDIICRCRRRYVEQVRIRPECVEFVLLLPPGRRVVYSLEARGHRPLSPERQQTLCRLMIQDYPLLCDKARYTLRKEKRPLPNGGTEPEYVYTINTRYKDALNRAPYYMQH